MIFQDGERMRDDQWGGAPPVVGVFAEDALMRLRMTRRLRTYPDVTDAELALDLFVEGWPARA